MNIKTRNSAFYYLMILFLFMFATIRPIGLDPDSTGYQNWIVYDLYTRMGEPAFVYIVEFWKIFFVDDFLITRLVLATFAFIHLFILHLAIKQYTDCRFQSLVLFFFLLYSISLLTQIRIGIASAIFFWSVKDIRDRNLVVFVLKVLLAYMFHNMALLFFVFYFFGSRLFSNWVYYSIFPVGLVLWFSTNKVKIIFINHFLDYLPDFASIKIQSYLIETDQAISTFNLWFLFVVFIYYASVYAKDRLGEGNRTYINLIGIGILLYFSVNFMSILSIRIMNSVGLLVLILIPKLIEVYRPRLIAIIIFYSGAIIIFLNWHIRNTILSFEAFSAFY
ncbi:EpsG family protein [Vibrio coralliilyticus]|uniref:EpsG family protein n=1 Tax=Vibrio coralliilyticus TaxID=190893 RepID=UPI003916EC9E